jgi:hypothetical protein
MRFPFLAGLLLLPAAAMAQDASPAKPEIPSPPGVETIYSDADHYVETIRVNGTGWIAAGSRPQDYEMGIGPATGTLGAEAFVIRAKPEGRNAGFGTLMQMHPPGRFLGKRVRLSARMKTDAVRRAQLWMRVDGKGRSVPLAFYNMDDQPVEGSKDWERFAIVLDVAGDASAIAYGFFVSGGKGTAWMDGLTLEVVSKDVPVSD